ncbi:ABC transporter ATP-binding protein [Halorussus halobius]|uniref:ABC transporter ATP-binding protein n=1 Tax=Halorussus halobius TaxID=1710537 RepID=UPI001091A145|nr:ABC transporter ATP-binding protein [Halorussus halobius]
MKRRALSLNDIVAEYGQQRVLNGVDLRLDSGCTAIIGPNGAGKTTLFRVGAGVLEPTRGTVTIRGDDPFDNPAIKAEVGYVPHIPSLTSNLSVRRNLQFWGRVLDLTPEYVRERIDELADSLEFHDLLSKDGGELSRGQSQRIAIARGLLSEPSILFLDEPTAGLDPSIRSNLLQLLRRLGTSDKTVLYATHNLHEANQLADDVALLRDGTVVRSESRDEIIAEYSGRRLLQLKLASNEQRSVIRELGYEPSIEGEYVQFEVEPDTTVTDVVEQLADLGVKVEDVRTDENALQHFFEGEDRVK